jgi:hypothetical protein
MDGVSNVVPAVEFDLCHWRGKPAAWLHNDQAGGTLAGMAQLCQNIRNVSASRLNGFEP